MRLFTSIISIAAMLFCLLSMSEAATAQCLNGLCNLKAQAAMPATLLVPTSTSIHHDVHHETLPVTTPQAVTYSEAVFEGPQTVYRKAPVVTFFRNRRPVRTVVAAIARPFRCLHRGN